MARRPLISKLGSGDLQRQRRDVLPPRWQQGQRGWVSLWSEPVQAPGSPSLALKVASAGVCQGGAFSLLAATQHPDATGLVLGGPRDCLQQGEWVDSAFSLDSLLSPLHYLEAKS